MKVTKKDRNNFHLLAFLLKNSKNKKKILKRMETVTITRVILKTKLCYTLWKEIRKILTIIILVIKILGLWALWTEAETEKLSWENLVSKTKEEIKNELTKIFGSATADEKVPYLGRMRDRFPCPVTACRFNNVDPATHLCQTPMVKLSSKTSSELF